MENGHELRMMTLEGYLLKPFCLWWVEPYIYLNHCVNLAFFCVFGEFYRSFDIII